MPPPARIRVAGLRSLASAVMIVLGCSLHAAENKTAAGIITSKTARPAGVYEQYPGGRRGGFPGPSEIPIAESVLFQIKVDGLGTVRYSANTVAAKQFEIGQRVQITYVKRAIMPLRKRIYVLEMRPGAAGASDGHAPKPSER